MNVFFPDWGQLITLGIIAIALGMDAWSFGMGLGMRDLPRDKMAGLVILIGLFHVLMPLLGMKLGHFLSGYIHAFATILGGAVLCFLGGNMLIHSFLKEEKAFVFNEKSWLGICLFALSVSVDSLSAGLSLGFFATNQWLAASLSGIAGAVMAGIGLWMGKYVGNWLGSYGEALGGIILFVLGTRFLW
jgi:putative Mn2+ efflux pump MntP